MDRILRRLAALALSAVLLASSALALTPQELGEILKNEYVGDIPRQVWEQTTVEGMLNALGDPFTHYYDAEGYATFREQAATGLPTDPNTYAVEDGVGWARINSFGDWAELGQWVADAGAHGWVLDLRGNRGGELQPSVEAMAIFAGGGPVVYLRDHEGKLYAAKRQSDTRATMYPAVVLVGEKTASAAELFAAAIRDRQKGILIGSRTYGKGVAQTAFDKDHPIYGAAFADGSGLVLTTNLVYSDAMTAHNIMGVLPHLMVPDDKAEAVARLFCAEVPTGSVAGWLRIHLARWRWFIKLDDADPAALQTMLEALPPQVELYLGTSGGDWLPTTAVEVATRQRLWGYTPRTFADVSASPYADAINALKTYGIVKGDQNGNYNPADGLTRASLCALLAQAMDYPKSSAAPAFADTPADAWYTPYVTTLSALGIVNGYDDGLFHPDDPIPHQQFMTILARIIANTNYTSGAALKAGPTEEALASGDYAAYDPWAVPGAWLLDGAWHKDARDIDPRAVTTREEAAYDLWSALSTLGLLPG